MADRPELAHPFGAIAAHAASVLRGVGFDFSRYARKRRRSASAIHASPQVVSGPVERPPWNLLRDLPRSTRTRQLPQSLVLAPHSGRSLTLEFHEAVEIRDRKSVV